MLAKLPIRTKLVLVAILPLIVLIGFAGFAVRDAYTGAGGKTTFVGAISEIECRSCFATRAGRPTCRRRSCSSSSRRCVEPRASRPQPPRTPGMRRGRLVRTRRPSSYLSRAASLVPDATTPPCSWEFPPQGPRTVRP
jgi:hypothetical protein